MMEGVAIVQTNREGRRAQKMALELAFVIAQIALMIGLYIKGYPAFIRGVAASIVFWLAYVWVESNYGIYMNNYVRAVVLLAIVSDGFFGYYLGFYASSNVFDKLQHIFGSYAFALFAYVLAVQWLKYALPQPIASVFIISLGVSIGAFYEIAEFFVDMWGNPVMPSQPSLQDTDLDLIGDAVGSLVAALHCNYVDFIGNRSSTEMKVG